MLYALNSNADGSSQVLWEDGERIFCRGRRMADQGTPSGVLLVAPAADHPSRSSLDRLTHEYELKDELDGASAVRPLDLIRDAGRTMLVLEDPAASRLSDYLARLSRRTTSCAWRSTSPWLSAGFIGEACCTRT